MILLMKIKKMMTILFLNSLLFSVCSLFGMQEQGSLSVEVKDVLNLAEPGICIAYLKLLSSDELTKFKEGINVVLKNEFESVNHHDLFVQFEEIRRDEGVSGSSETKKYELNENDVDYFLFFLNQMPVFHEKIDFTKKFTDKKEFIESIEKKDENLAYFIRYINKTCKLDEKDCEEPPMIIFDIKSENKLIKENYDNAIFEEEGEDEGEDEEELEKKIKSNRLVHRNLYIQSYLKNEKVQTDELQTDEQREVYCKKMIHYLQEKLENLKQFHEVGILDLYWKGYQLWKNNCVKDNSQNIIGKVFDFGLSCLKREYDAFKKQETFKEKYGELLFETIHPEKDLENYEEGGESTTQIRIAESSTIEILDIDLEKKFEKLSAKEKVEQFSDLREQLKKDFDVEIEKCKKAMKKLAEQYEEKKQEKLKQKKQ